MKTLLLAAAARLAALAEVGTAEALLPIAVLIVVYLARKVPRLVGGFVLDLFTWYPFGLDPLGDHKEEAERLRIDKETRRQQKQLDRQLAAQRRQEEKQRQLADAERRRQE